MARSLSGPMSRKSSRSVTAIRSRIEILCVLRSMRLYNPTRTRQKKTWWIFCVQPVRQSTPNRHKFGNSGEPHSVLAGLPLAIVITTNYDDFMVRALKWKLKDARREICRWQDILQHVESIFEKEPGYKPTPANPLVFHLHGALDVSESLVLTEDDDLSSSPT